MKENINVIKQDEKLIIKLFLGTVKELASTKLCCASYEWILFVY